MRTQLELAILTQKRRRFTQPGLDEVVDRDKGTTFGEFSREVMRRFH